MDYSKAIELLGLTTVKSLSENARLAAGMLSHMTSKCPLRYKVAASVVMAAGE